MKPLNIVPDVLKTMDKKLNKKKNIFQDDSEEERINISDWLVIQLTVPKSVSYTHLDVYKRQCQRWRKALSEQKEIVSYN